MAIDTEIQARQKKMWTVGDYPTIANRIRGVSEEVVERLGAGEGIRMLDVATGSGNAALIAAVRGAQVTGVDITPKLLDVARERAAEAGLKVKFVEGDAQELPFDDQSFDRVTSIFGAIFAPDQQRTAAELVRVCKPGGKIAVTAWTPEGLVGRSFILMASHQPPPPPGFTPPILWGVEDRVRELFEPHEVSLELERRSVVWSGESVEAWLDEDERLLGPAVMAKAALEPEGKWEAARADLAALFDELNEAEDGSFRCHNEYLLTVATVEG